MLCRWLYAIATRTVPLGGDPAAIVAGRAGVRLAFVAALQLTPARQRAVLRLPDVLGFSVAETTEVLDTTVAAVDSALRRARAHLAGAAPDPDDVAEPADVAAVAATAVHGEGGLAGRRPGPDAGRGPDRAAFDDPALVPLFAPVGP